MGCKFIHNVLKKFLGSVENALFVHHYLGIGYTYSNLEIFKR
jgi:hypothetical protein